MKKNWFIIPVIVVAGLLAFNYKKIATWFKKKPSQPTT